MTLGNAGDALSNDIIDEIAIEKQEYLSNVTSKVIENFRALDRDRRGSFSNFVNLAVTYNDLIPVLVSMNFPQSFVAFIERELNTRFNGRKSLVEFAHDPKSQDSFSYMPPEVRILYSNSMFIVKSWFDMLKSDGLLPI